MFVFFILNPLPPPKSCLQICPLVVTFKKTYLIAPTFVMGEKIAVILWQAANVAPTQGNLNASVKKDTMAKGYSMNVQVSITFLLSRLLI